jgi:predicted AAA+ superfamily ATPase
MKMRPLSWFELGYSTGEVSLNKLLQGLPPESAQVAKDIPGIAERIARGGWPENAASSTKNAMRMVRDYVDLIADVDLSRVSNQRRDPFKVRALMASIARNIATEASIETLTTDARRDSTTFDRDTISSYLDALGRIMILEDLPAFNATLRSSATLRTTPKRHFVDPSIAVGAIGEDVDYLMSDLKYLGFLFESLVIHDLRVYADAIDAKVFFYRDSSGQEVDAIVQKRNGNWAAFEVKLGYGAVEDGAKSLLKFASKIDTDRMSAPMSLNIITGSGIAHKRTDGVNIVPLGILGI